MSKKIYKQLDAAHDALSEVVENPESTREELQKAAVNMCLVLNRLYAGRVQKRKEEKERQVTVNKEQGLYVLPIFGGGYSCLGFQVAYDWAKGYAAFANVEPPKPGLIGELAGYWDYKRCLDAASDHAQKTKTRCNIHLIPELIGLEGKRVEVTDAYGETRRFIVGKSTGWAPCHLEIANRNSTGGGSVTGAPFKSLRVIEGGR